MASGAANTNTSPIPCPASIAALRDALYAPLAQIANRWNETLGDPMRYPDEHAAFLARCHKAGQTPPDAASAAIWRRRL